MIAPDKLVNRGYLIAFSTSQGLRASDNGQYAQALAGRLKAEGLSLDQVFEQVRQSVGSSTQQVPIYVSTLMSKVCLVSCDAVAAGPYGQNRILLESARNDADAAMKRLEALQPETRCQRGWTTLIELRDSARKQLEVGHPDAAGKTYTEITARARQIQAYLLTLDSIEASQQRMAEIRSQNAASIQERSKKRRERSEERSKASYDRYRDMFARVKADVAASPKTETQQKD